MILSASTQAFHGTPSSKRGRSSARVSSLCLVASLEDVARPSPLRVKRFTHDCSVSSGPLGWNASQARPLTTERP